MTRCRIWKKKYPVILPEYKNKQETVNTYALIDVLSDLLTKNDLIVPGSSGSRLRYSCRLQGKKGQRIFNDPALAPMGLAFPQALAARLQATTKPLPLSGRRTAT